MRGAAPVAYSSAIFFKEQQVAVIFAQEQVFIIIAGLLVGPLVRKIKPIELNDRYRIGPTPFQISFHLHIVTAADYANIAGCI